MTPLAGHFLIAFRSLQDPHFARSVTLMIQHSDEGAMGLVINQPTPVSMKDVWEQLTRAQQDADDDEEPWEASGAGVMIGECERDEMLFRGGPCPGPLMVLHTDDRYASDTPAGLPGLFLTVDRDMIGLLVRSDAEPVRFITGYAGWGPGQLEAEFTTGSWRALPATVDLAMGDPDSLWDDLTRQHMAELLGGVNPAIVPLDPSAN